MARRKPGRSPSSSGKGRAARVRADDRGGPPGVAGGQRRRHPGLARQHPARPPRLGVALRPSPLPFRPAHAQGAHGAVWSASFSPDGSRIVTGSRDRTAKVWDARSGAEVLTLKGHTDQRHFGVVQPDGSRVVTGSEDKTAKVWDARSGAEVLTLKGHTGQRHVGVVQPRRLADRHRELGQDGEGLGRQDRRRAPHAQGAHRPGHFGVVQPRRLADRHRESGQDGEGLGRQDRRRGPHAQGAHRSRLFGVVQPGRLAHRHRECGQDGEGLGRQERAELLTLKGHTDQVTSASFSPDGSRVVTGSDDQTAKVWDARSGAEVLTLKGHTVTSSRRRSAPTARGSSPRVGTGRRRSGTPEERRRGPHAQGARSPRRIGVVQPDGSRLVTGSGDETAKVWDAKSGAEVLTLKGHTGPVEVGVVQPRRLAGRHRECGQDGEGLGRQERCRGPHAQGAHRSGLVGVVQPRRLADRHREWGQDGEGLGRQERRRGPHAQGAHQAHVQSASFSPDGSRIVTGSDDKTAKVWDARSGAEALTLKGHTGSGRFGVVQPRRLADRHRQCGRDGEGLGRPQRRRDPHPQGAHRPRLFGVVQPRRLADRHRRVTTRRRRSGTPRAAPRSSRSRGTPTGSLRRRSAPTARGSSPPVGTERRRSGTPRRSRRVIHRLRGPFRQPRGLIVDPRHLKPPQR